MATSQFDSFIKTLKKVFMLDQADLDFGIYRIMNQKRKDIEKYLNENLKTQVTEVLNNNKSSQVSELENELKEARKAAEMLGISPDDMPKVKELKAKIVSLGNTEDLENEVYSHLSTFFSRYYDGGDFISQRRYKKDVYAIPYEGEEVKLHWANADQYYIKTSEYFRNYRFKLDNGKYVEFTLKEVSTEQNNDKPQNNMEHRFALYSECPVEVINDELHINFTYELYPKATKQKSLIESAFNVVKDLLPSEFKMDVLALRPTDSDRGRTLLQKHLNDYVARNTFDYFIHKDLKGFLSRELDFYIKNEILEIDDIDARTTESFLAHLTVIKAIKNVGSKIIDFLASLENFQKRLWLKKKMVVSADYCITLDRVPEKFYAEICANDSQREEWVKLFAIDEIKSSQPEGFFNEGAVTGYSIPVTEQFLKENPFLVLDTAFFTDDFKRKLISEIDDLDEVCDGLLINSENFQALNLIGEKYNGVINMVVTDPPYNTGDDDFLYKDNFCHSSWLTMMYDRISLLYSILSDNSWCSFNINDIELFNLMKLLETMNWSTRTNLTVKMSHLSGMKMSHIDKKVPKIKESIILLSKGLDYKLTPIYEQCSWDEAFDRYTSWIDRNNSSRPEDWTHRSVRQAALEYGVDIENSKEFDIFRIQNADKIYQRAKNDSLNGYPHDDIFREIVTPTGLKKIVLDAKEVLLASSYLKKINGQYVPVRPKGDIWDDIGINNVHNEGGVQLPNGKKPVKLFERLIALFSQKESVILDPFAGSATLAHAVVNICERENAKHKYILVQEGYRYFEDKTKRRLQNIMYSNEWKLDKPISRKGRSHCFKYMRLEQYEDTLNNLVVKKNTLMDQGGEFFDGYMLGYLLDTETKDSLFSLDWFVNPWNTKLKITRNNETKEEKIDLVETFNYLIGLKVQRISYPKSDICVVEGYNRKEEHILIIWRDCTKVSNEDLNEFFRRMAYSTRDKEFDKIYVNGDNNLENLKTDADTWKVTLIEQEFSKRMFEAE